LSALIYSGADILETEVCISAAVGAIYRGHGVCTRLTGICGADVLVVWVAVQWQAQLSKSLQMRACLKLNDSVLHASDFTP